MKTQKVRSRSLIFTDFADSLIAGKRQTFQTGAFATPQRNCEGVIFFHYSLSVCVCLSECVCVSVFSEQNSSQTDAMMRSFKFSTNNCPYLKFY